MNLEHDKKIKTLSAELAVKYGLFLPVSAAVKLALADWGVRESN